MFYVNENMSDFLLFEYWQTAAAELQQDTLQSVRTFVFVFVFWPKE